MTKLIFLFFFILQAAGNQSAERLRFQARVLACPEAFLSHKSPLKDYLQREWQNPSAENLLNSYAATEKSHWVNRRSDRRKLEQGLVWTMEFLERSLTPAEQKIFENLSLELLTKALGKLPEIQAFMNEISESTTATESSKPLTVSQAEKRMLQVYVQAVFVTFGKFIPTILTKKAKNKDQLR